MTDVTQVLAQIDSGDPTAAEQLLPLVDDELRRLAASKLAHERPGQTLQATALVHEAYLMLVGDPLRNSAPCWKSRRQFFAAAGEAMRRILIMSARRRNAEKRGGRHRRIDLDPALFPGTDRDERLLALDETLTRLEQRHPEKALLVKLGATLLVSTYQANKLLAVRVDGSGLSTLVRTLDKPMGLAAKGSRLAIGTRKEVWLMRNEPDIASRIEPAGTHDACYMPRSSHVTGDVGVHEVAWAGEELWLALSLSRKRIGLYTSRRSCRTLADRL